MTYKEYLRFRRKVEKLRAAGRAVGRGLCIIGGLVLFVMMGATEGSDLTAVAKVYSAGLGLLALGGCAQLI